MELTILHYLLDRNQGLHKSNFRCFFELFKSYECQKSCHLNQWSSKISPKTCEKEPMIQHLIMIQVKA